MLSTTVTSLVPSTPRKALATPPPALPSPAPGRWRHPKFTEIVARQSASSFSERNLKAVIVNTVALLISITYSSVLDNLLYRVLALLALPNATEIGGYGLMLLRLYLLSNAVMALRPLAPYSIQPKDKIADIPLTPSQRALFGLEPSASTPNSTSSSNYITPPRYRRSSGSFSTSSPNTHTSDRRSISANHGSSPLSASRISNSPSPFRNTQRTSIGSPLTHSPIISPLLQRAVMRDASGSPRQNFGASTGALGVSRSQSVRERGSRGGREGDPASPSPIGSGVKRSPGLNYKWLYEKGKKLPKSDSMQF